MTSYGSSSRIISYNNSRSSSNSNHDDADVSVLDESIALSPYELSLIYDINNSNNNPKPAPSSSSSPSSHHYIGQNSIFPTSISNDYDSLLASHILITTSSIINITVNTTNNNTANAIDSKFYDSFIQNCWTIKKKSISITSSNDSTTDMVQLSKQIESFIKAFSSSREYLLGLDEVEVASLASWLSWPATRDICMRYLSYYSKHDTIVNGFVSLLNEPDHDTNCLVMIVTCLSYLIDGHHMMDSVLTDSNITQLMTLLISKIIYPSSSTKLIHQEYCISLCRLGLRRLLSINRVKDGNTATNEAFNFILKWWPRLHGATLGPGSGFETPSKLLPSYTCKRVIPIPVVRNAIMIMTDLLNMLPTLKVTMCKEISIKSAAFVHGVEFFRSYINSTDPRTCSTATVLISILLNTILDNPTHYATNTNLMYELKAILNIAVTKVLHICKVADSNHDEDGNLPFWIGPFSDITNSQQKKFASNKKKKASKPSSTSNINNVLMLVFEPLLQVLVPLIENLLLFSNKVSTDMLNQSCIDAILLSLKFHCSFIKAIASNKSHQDISSHAVSYPLFTSIVRTLYRIHQCDGGGGGGDSSTYIRRWFHSNPDVLEVRTLLLSTNILKSDDDNMLTAMSASVEGCNDDTTDDINISVCSSQYPEIVMFTNSPLVSIHSNGNETIRNDSTSFSIDVHDSNDSNDSNDVNRQEMLDAQLKCIELEKKVLLLTTMLDNEKAKNNEKQLIASIDEVSLSKRCVENKLKCYVDENATLRNELIAKDELIASAQIRYDILEKDKAVQEASLREAWESLTTMSKVVEEARMEAALSKEASNNYQEIARGSMDTINKMKDDLFDLTAQVMTMQDELKHKNNHINDLNNRISSIQQSQTDAEQQRDTIMSQMNHIKLQLDKENVRCQKVEQDFINLKRGNNDLKLEIACLKEREAEQQLQYESALNEIEDMRNECVNLQAMVDTTKKAEKKANKTLKELKAFINKVSVPSTPGGLTQDD